MHVMPCPQKWPL